MGQTSKRAFRLATACVALAAFDPGGGALALDRQKALTQLVLDSWQTEEGLPQSSVHAILQSRDGFLWVGTEERLVRSDGTGFRVYDRSNTPGLRNDQIWTLAEDRGGTLWIGTYGGGLNRFDGERFAEVAGLASDQVGSFCEDRGGALWVGTGAGPCRMEGGPRRLLRHPGRAFQRHRLPDPGRRDRQSLVLLQQGGLPRREA